MRWSGFRGGSASATSIGPMVLGSALAYAGCDPKAPPTLVDESVRQAVLLGIAHVPAARRSGALSQRVPGRAGADVWSRASISRLERFGFDHDSFGGGTSISGRCWFVCVKTFGLKPSRLSKDGLVEW